MAATSQHQGSFKLHFLATVYRPQSSFTAINIRILSLLSSTLALYYLMCDPQCVRIHCVRDILLYVDRYSVIVVRFHFETYPL